MSEAPDETTAEPETQEQDGPEPEAEPTPEEEEAESEEVEGQPSAMSEREIEKRNQALDKEAIRHAKRVHEIVGEDIAALVPCELCVPIIPGFHFPVIPDEQRAAVMLAIGMASEAELEQAPDADRCPDCQGKGRVKTRSFVTGQEALVCIPCNGRGWIGPRAATATLPAPQPAVAEQANGAPEVVPASPEVAEAMRLAQSAGLIVIDPHANAPR